MIRLLVTLALGASLLPAQLVPPAPGQKPLSFVGVANSPSGNGCLASQGQVNYVNGTLWVCVLPNLTSIVGTWQQVSGGSANPGGANTATQFNNAGAFGGDAANFFYNTSTHVLATTGGFTATGGTVNFNAATLLVTTGPSSAPTTAAAFAFESTNGLFMGGDGHGHTNIDAYFRGAPPTAGNCIQAASGGGLYQLSDTGSPCGSGGGGAATSIRAGLLSGLPGTCAAGDVYFATNQPAGEQLYQCDSTNHFTETFLHDTTLVNTAGSFGVSLSQFCQFTNSCTVSSFWNFTGAAATAPNKSGLISALPGTCVVGQTYFATNATAGANIYSCTASNTWTPPSGGVTLHNVISTNVATAQTVPASNVLTSITYDTNVSITNATLHDTSTNTQNFVADETGIWEGSCQVTPTNDNVDFSIIMFFGATAVYNNGGAHTVGAQNMPWSYPLTSGDIVTCQASSSVGFTVSSVGTTMYMHRVH